jgi:hypothetical protein
MRSSNMRQRYAIRLEGVEAFDLSLSVLRDLGDLLVEGAQRAARLAVEGRSTARGTPPAWTSAVADLRVVSFADGSLALSVEAPRLVDAAPEVFGQPALFGRQPGVDASALDLLLDAVDDAVAGRRDSDRLDSGVLELLVGSGGLFARGGTRLTISCVGRTPTMFDAASLQAVRRLAEETPAARATRVRGVLDTVTVSTRSVAVRLDDGRVLRGFAGAVPIEQLRDFLGTDVVVEGTTSFRPSGDPLRIEIDHAARATDQDRVWARWPRIEPSPARSRATDTGGGLASVFGSWPGDETDEELARALAESA